MRSLDRRTLYNRAPRTTLFVTMRQEFPVIIAFSVVMLVLAFLMVSGADSRRRR